MLTFCAALAACSGHSTLVVAPEGDIEVKPTLSDNATGLFRATPAKVTPKTLQGLSAPELRALLGHPDLSRHEPSAEIWSYFGERCVVQVYLYRKLGSSRYQVTFVDTFGVQAAQPLSCSIPL